MEKEIQLLEIACIAMAEAIEKGETVGVVDKIKKILEYIR